MRQHLFQPRRIRLEKDIVLVPYFPDEKLLQEIRKECSIWNSLLNASLAAFPDFFLLTSFLGYSHLLTLLEFFALEKSQRVFFLGTAGALLPFWRQPTLLQVNRIYGDPVLRTLNRRDSLPLRLFPECNLESVSAISVDLIQRETRTWLLRQRKRKVAAVEMELFALRAFLKKPFSALLVLTDRVELSGIQSFPQKKLVAAAFRQGWEIIRSEIAAASVRL